MEAVAQLVALVCQVASRSACLPALRLVSWENSLMGYNFAGGGDGDQVFLLPPDPRDWLPPQHLAWAMRRAARELDLALFLAAYRADGQGNTAYHPRMMVALVMYCYAKGIRSSRAIEMATFDDVGARVICGGLHPDHATNARFAGRHKEPLKGLLVQSLVACAREGLVRVDITAGDGTKVKASASMAANATAEQLGLEIAELEKLLEAEVQAWIEQACAADVAEDALFSEQDVPPPAGRPAAGAARKRTAGKLARRTAARAKLEAGARARQEQAGAERAGKIARLAAEKDRLEARAAGELAKGQAKVARYEQRAAAGAAGSATWPPPASRTGSARHCSTPGTHPRTTSPPAAAQNCTSPSPANRSRPGNCPAARPRSAASPAGRPWPPGWTPPKAAPSTSSARPSSSRSSPSCSPASAAPCTTAATWSPPRSTCGPPCTTRSRPSAPAPAASTANAAPPASPPWQPHNRPPGRPGNPANPRPATGKPQTQANYPAGPGPAAATPPGLTGTRTQAAASRANSPWVM